MNRPSDLRVFDVWRTHQTNQLLLAKEQPRMANSSDERKTRLAVDLLLGSGEHNVWAAHFLSA